MNLLNDKVTARVEAKINYIQETLNNKDRTNIEKLKAIHNLFHSDLNLSIILEDVLESL